MKILSAESFSEAEPILLSEASRTKPLTLSVCGSAGVGKTEFIRRMQASGNLIPESQGLAKASGSRLAKSSQGRSPQSPDPSEGAGTSHISREGRDLLVNDPGNIGSSIREIAVSASRSDAAIVLVDTEHGVNPQLLRQLLILSKFGVSQVIFAVNKMDRVKYSKRVFHAIADACNDLAKTFGLSSNIVIPVCALDGGNIGTRSDHLGWYEGPIVLEVIDRMSVSPPDRERFVMPVQWIRSGENQIDAYGTIRSGRIHVGEEVRIVASGSLAKVSAIFTAGCEVQSAEQDDPVALRLISAQGITRADTLTSPRQPLELSDQFEVTLVWLDGQPGLAGRSYDIQLATQRSTATITSIRHGIDAENNRPVVCKKIGPASVAVCHIGTGQALAFDVYLHSRDLGGFTLLDRTTGEVVACGMIRHSLRRAQNIHRQALQITRTHREKLNGQQGKVIWFTGLSGSGKSTIANALEVQLHNKGFRTYILDGDNIRHGLNRDLGFAESDRVENIRRVAEVAKLMLDAGLVVITSFISPFRTDREMARDLIGSDDFIEVFVDTPLSICEKRDVKGLYKKAREGKLPNFTGISSPYEPPSSPAAIVNGGSEELSLSVQKIMSLLVNT